MDSDALHIVHTVGAPPGGGAQHAVLRLCEVQRERGHDAAILAVTSGPLIEAAGRKGLPVTVLRGDDKMKRVLHATSHFALHRSEIVHCHDPASLHYATIAKLTSGARLVFTDHAQPRGGARTPKMFEWRLVDAYVSASAEAAHRAGEVGYRGEPEIVHDGIDVVPARRSRAEVRAELGVEGRVVAVNNAAFFALKAHDVLLRAAAELKARGVPISVLFLGEGTERAERPALEKLAADLGLGPEHARFLGPRADAPDILGASDLFVLPSRAEGFPTSILEAMSHRLPVVCTPVGGSAEIVTDGEHGAIVPVDDPAALADAIGKIGADPALRARLGEAGYARVRDEFSFALTTDRYEAVYRKALAAPIWDALTRRT
jgi:glycosyltransferase involved in cell wall biosynthesis